MKRIVSALLIAVCLASMLLSLPFTVSAESLYIRKIVSVVYDDSGSMSGEKHSYANYAMQAFCGMLNSEDQLFITYMSHTVWTSNYTPEKMDLSASEIQDSVDSIRSHNDSGSTPYGAVEIAYNKLKSVQDSNPNTQYWLVVITDGAFNECSGMTVSKSKQFLNEEFEKYTSGVMPNGTNPQVTFMGIGGVVMPDENESKGIYTFNAKSAGDITDTMSEMADRISGRTRLAKSDITQVDSKTIQVSSSIPLLNIAVLVQESSAKITKAVYSNEVDIPISRSVSLHFPNYSDLVGGAFLLGDSQKVIGSGTYNITFDRDIELDDVVILFEPALEMRMTITVNGREIADYSELDNVSEGDEVSISCKIYEMGTDTEIDPSLMPPGTKFEITVSEDGKVTDKSTGEDMVLKDYVLKNLETELTASVTIEGFNPIEFSAKFTPQKYVPKVVYTITPSFVNNVKSVKLDDIATNQSMSVCFTVSADGVPMKDSAAVKALNPVITVSPQGNSGTVSYTDDGMIVFTPNAASMPPTGAESFSVDVTCAIDDGTAVTETYTVLISDYQVIPADATQSVKKNQFFDNRVGVSFYITKDGIKLDKAAVESYVSVSLNEAHSQLKTDVTVAADGTITVIPYSEQDRALTFWKWWSNWYDYCFCLSGEDVVVTLSHPYGTANATIDVVQESLLYILLNVATPWILEALIIGFIIWWICCICFKPKFLPDAVIYTGRLEYGGARGDRHHEVSSLSMTALKRYNKLKYRWKPTMKTQIVYIDKDLSVSAGDGGSIICHCQVWYKGEIAPKNRTFVEFEHPEDVKAYLTDHDSLKIKALRPYDANVQPVETVDDPKNEIYYVQTKQSNITPVDGILAIESGTIFAYSYRRDNT